MMLDMLSLMVGLVSMTAEENVWESGEEKMTLLPEAVGAGMWKPEYEFPGMHRAQHHSAKSGTVAMQRHARSKTQRHTHTHRRKDAHRYIKTFAHNYTCKNNHM